MLVFFVFLFGFFSFVFGGSNSSNGCPPNSIGLQLNSSICYSFYPGLLQFVAAERECNSFGATLVSVNDNYTNVYVTQLANVFFQNLGNKKFWANGHRLIGSKTFYQWINGNQIQYELSNDDEMGDTQGCMVVDLETGSIKFENCFLRLPYVCEFVADEVKQVPGEHIDFKTFVNETIDILSSTTIQQLISTSTTDVTEPSTTVMPLDPTITMFSDSTTTELRTTHLWKTSTTTIPTNPPTTTTVLTTETSLETTPPPLITEPQTTKLQTTEIPLETTTTLPVITDPTISTVPTTETTLIITDPQTTTTEIPTTTTSITTDSSTVEIPTTTTTTPELPKTCPPTWTYSDLTGFCYFAISDMNWNDAEQKCIDEGAHLTSIHSNDEAVFVGRLAENTSRPHDAYTDQTYIGLITKDNGQSWQWTDGSPVDYIKWAKDEPNLLGHENCGEFWINNIENTGTSNNFYCDRIVKNAVCKKLPN